MKKLKIDLLFNIVVTVIILFVLSSCLKMTLGSLSIETKWRKINGIPSQTTLPKIIPPQTQKKIIPQETRALILQPIPEDLRNPHVE